MKRARGHASGHPRMSFCVVNVTLLESCVYGVARARSHGRWGLYPPSPLSAYPDPLRHARRPGKSGSGVRRPPGARVSTLDISYSIISRARLARTGDLEVLACYRYRLTVRSGRRPCDAGRVARCYVFYARVTFSFSRALGPRSGRQEPVAFYLLKHVRILRLSRPRSRRRRVVARCRAGYVL